MEESRVLLILIREQGEDEKRINLKREEISALVNNLGLTIVAEKLFTLKEENNVYFIGKGQATEAEEYLRAFDITEVIFDAFLSPRTEMNLEKLFKVPVSDREAVILSIFYQNAHSREALLQIEKAEAIYQKPRLIFREANLSQQRGGVRGAKGEGEKELELERRTIDNKIKALDRELNKIKTTRLTQRKRRKKNELFSFALVGYTNAGKSTILNTLTSSSVLSEDKLFATLDTTTRSLKLPSKDTILLSDTVGFIQNLPPSLIEAFSSTLEEALDSDALIIVCDISHPDSIGSFETTKKTLQSLNCFESVKLIIINKIDAPHDDFSLEYIKSQGIPTVETSMTDNKGIPELLAMLSKIASENMTHLYLTLPYSSPLLGELSKENRIEKIEYGENEIKVNVYLPQSEAKRINEALKSPKN